MIAVNRPAGRSRSTPRRACTAAVAATVGAGQAAGGRGGRCRSWVGGQCLGHGHESCADDPAPRIVRPRADRRTTARAGAYDRGETSSAGGRARSRRRAPPGAPGRGSPSSPAAGRRGSSRWPRRPRAPRRSPGWSGRGRRASSTSRSRSVRAPSRRRPAREPAAVGQRLREVVEQPAGGARRDHRVTGVHRPDGAAAAHAGAASLSRNAAAPALIAAKAYSSRSKVVSTITRGASARARSP